MVGGARVHLLGGARMEGQRRSAGLDEPRAYYEAVARAVAEAAPELDADRVVEQRGTRSRLRHLPYRAAEVQVDEIRAGRLDHASGLGHRAGLRPEELD